MGKDELLAVCRAVNINASGHKLPFLPLILSLTVGFRAWKNGLIGSVENSLITVLSNVQILPDCNGA